MEEKDEARFNVSYPFARRFYVLQKDSRPWNCLKFFKNNLSINLFLFTSWLN